MRLKYPSSLSVVLYSKNSAGLKYRQHLLLWQFGSVPMIPSFHPPPSAILTGMLNTISYRITQVAIRDVQRMTGSCRSIISLSFQFCMHSSTLVTSIMSAIIGQPKATFMMSGTILKHEFTIFASFTKCSLHFSPFTTSSLHSTMISR